MTHSRQPSSRSACLSGPRLFDRGIRFSRFALVAAVAVCGGARREEVIYAACGGVARARAPSTDPPQSRISPSGSGPGRRRPRAGRRAGRPRRPGPGRAGWPRAGRGPAEGPAPKWKSDRRPCRPPVAAREEGSRPGGRLDPPGDFHEKMPLVGQRRPALPRTDSAVPSALGGLTSGFGMGPGVPPPPWSLTNEGHSAVRGRARWPRPGGRTARNGSVGRTLRQGTCRHPRQSMKGRARAISDARLSASPRLHLRPIDLVVYEGPYRREDSSRDWLPA